MFAVFGEIIFELLGSPDAFESSQTWHYAEHRVIEDRPQLQWMTAGLETLELGFLFHISFTDPSTQAAALIAAAEDHSARALVFGNGIHRGYFIVTSISSISRQTSANGDLIAIALRATLKEWALESKFDPSAAPVATFPLLGIVADLGSRSSFEGTSGVATIGTSRDSFIAPSFIAPGVSPILNLPRPAGLSAPRVNPNDIPPKVIVRSHE